MSYITLNSKVANIDSGNHPALGNPSNFSNQFRQGIEVLPNSSVALIHATGMSNFSQQNWETNDYGMRLGFCSLSNQFQRYNRTNTEPYNTGGTTAPLKTCMYHPLPKSKGTYAQLLQDICRALNTTSIPSLTGAFSGLPTYSSGVLTGYKIENAINTMTAVVPYPVSNNLVDMNSFGADWKFIEALGVPRVQKTNRPAGNDEFEWACAVTQTEGIYNQGGELSAEIVLGQAVDSPSDFDDYENHYYMFGVKGYGVATTINNGGNLTALSRSWERYEPLSVNTADSVGYDDLTMVDGLGAEFAFQSVRFNNRSLIQVLKWVNNDVDGIARYVVLATGIPTAPFGGTYSPTLVEAISPLTWKVFPDPAQVAQRVGFKFLFTGNMVQFFLVTDAGLTTETELVDAGGDPIRDYSLKDSLYPLQAMFGLKWGAEPPSTDGDYFNNPSGNLINGIATRNVLCPDDEVALDLQQWYIDNGKMMPNYCYNLDQVIFTCKESNDDILIADTAAGGNALIDVLTGVGEIEREFHIALTSPSEMTWWSDAYNGFAITLLANIQQLLFTTLGVIKGEDDSGGDYTKLKGVGDNDDIQGNNLNGGMLVVLNGAGGIQSNIGSMGARDRVIGNIPEYGVNDNNPDNIYNFTFKYEPPSPIYIKLNNPNKMYINELTIKLTDIYGVEIPNLLKANYLLHLIGGGSDTTDYTLSTYAPNQRS